jgi:hypothetical protein
LDYQDVAGVLAIHADACRKLVSSSPWEIGARSRRCALDRMLHSST